MPRARLRDLGIATGSLPPGPWNAITDVPGVRVGFTTLIRDEPSVVRTGVTAIWPRGPELWTDAVFAGIHSFNGNGEMTGWAWIAEQGLLASPLCITNTHAVGVVRDAVCALAVREKVPMPWLLPVVAETYDGWLSDAATFPITAEHAFAALDSAASGPVAEGNVGGGTGMICHEFKGGTGTASRVVATAGGAYTVGALVQANYGARELLRVDGVPVGREIGPDSVPSHRAHAERGWLDHRGARDRCAAAADPVPAPGATRHHRAGLGRRRRLQRQRRHLPRVRHRQPRPPGRAGQHCAHAVAGRDEPAVPGCGGSDRGGDPECADRGRDDDRASTATPRMHCRWIAWWG